MWVIRNRMVFIAHPKMASRSVREAMKKNSGFQVGSHHTIDIEHLELERRRGASIGCVIRNPYDVMVSWYFHMEVRKQTKENRGLLAIKSFPQWLDFILPKGNGYIEHGLFPGYHLCDTVMKFENLFMDWKAWCKKCRVVYHPLEHLGKSESRDGEHYSTYYDDESREKVRNKFAKEIALGGYSFVQV